MSTRLAVPGWTFRILRSGLGLNRSGGAGFPGGRTIGQSDSGAGISYRFQDRPHAGDSFLRRQACQRLLLDEPQRLCPVMRNGPGRPPAVQVAFMEGAGSSRRPIVHRSIVRKSGRRSLVSILHSREMMNPSRRPFVPGVSGAGGVL